MNPTLDTLDAIASAERSADLLARLFVGTFWLFVVVVLGVVLIAYIKGRFDP